METLSWTVDWNPEFVDEDRLKRAIKRALAAPRTVETIRRFAQNSLKEALEEGIETEHILWLESDLAYAFFVRVWYEMGEEKVFILIEENDLGDIGFLLLDGLTCARYDAQYVDDQLLVEIEEDASDDFDHGITP